MVQGEFIELAKLVPAPLLANMRHMRHQIVARACAMLWFAESWLRVEGAELLGVGCTAHHLKEKVHVSSTSFSLEDRIHLQEYLPHRTSAIQNIDQSAGPIGAGRVREQQ